MAKRRPLSPASKAKEKITKHAWYLAHREEILERNNKYRKEQYATNEDYRENIARINRRYYWSHHERVLEHARMLREKKRLEAANDDH